MRMFETQTGDTRFTSWGSSGVDRISGTWGPGGSGVAVRAKRGAQVFLSAVGRTRKIGGAQTTH